MLFSEFKLGDEILTVLQDKNYQEATPIQQRSIPLIQEGGDLLALAQTGTGKTASFVLPMLQSFVDMPNTNKKHKPTALILCPTRELAHQVADNCRLYGSNVKFTSTMIFGGAPRDKQVRALQRGVDVVIATPGRMIDMLCANNGRVTNLRRVTFLILDEADRMFDMGFEPQISAIVKNIRPDRQVCTSSF